MAGNDNDAEEGQGRPSEATQSTDGDDLAARLSDLARALETEDDVEKTLQAIVNAAVDTIPGAQCAGLMVVERRREMNTRAATDELVHRVDRAQFEADEGPCLDMAHEAHEAQAVRRMDDMSTEQRWPGFTRRAAELGVRSMLSFRLFVDKDTLGSLSLYSTEKNAFDDESEHVGLLFAAHAAVAMSDAQQKEQLSKAVSARDLIGQAKGILMERHKLTADQAFTVLARVSQETNTKLVEVALLLTETGEVSAARPQHRVRR
jgi:transcriptional regulator with GAF, ATPase, and Fis domain